MVLVVGVDSKMSKEMEDTKDKAWTAPCKDARIFVRGDDMIINVGSCFILASRADSTCTNKETVVPHF